MLLDVLQADDDDDDLLNGTPNAAAIIEGFDIHGIRLFSYVELEHTPVEFTPAETTVTVEAEANIVFPYVTYFDSMRLHYRLTPSAPWTTVPMGQETTCSPTTFRRGCGHRHRVLHRHPGCVWRHQRDHPGCRGQGCERQPAQLRAGGGGARASGRLGRVLGLRELGHGLPTDNATTGIWAAEIPVGSMGDVNDPSTVVAPLQDHTQGFFGLRSSQDSAANLATALAPTTWTVGTRPGVSGH